jgi:hypothetical protein
MTVTPERLQLGMTGTPPNLKPHVPANLIDGPILKGFPYTSRVVADPEDATCIAQRQKNKCDGEVGNCRACWTDPASIPRCAGAKCANPKALRSI